MVHVIQNYIYLLQNILKDWYVIEFNFIFHSIYKCNYLVYFILESKDKYHSNMLESHKTHNIAKIDYGCPLRPVKLL